MTRQTSGPFDRDYDTVSLVYAFREPAQVVQPLTTEVVESIEEALGGRVDLTQVITERGPAAGLSIPVHQVDLTFNPGRFEVRSRQPKFTKEVAQRMQVLVEQAVSVLGDARWFSIGHNFILTGRASEAAVKHVADRVLKDNLAETVGGELLGASVSLWVNVEGSRLLLRIDPLRASITTRNFTVNANFSVELSDPPELPSSEESLAHLMSYCGVLDNILKALKL